MMSTVVYVSRSVHPRGSHSDIDIVTTSIVKNRENNITGCLIRGNDWFAQILEGAHSDVTTTFDRIRSDPRHHDICFWWNNERGTRSFPEWRMIVANADTYGVDLLPLLRDTRISIAAKQNAMARLMDQHVQGFGFTTGTVDDAIEPEMFSHPARQQSAP